MESRGYFKDQIESSQSYMHERSDALQLRVHETSDRMQEASDRVQGQFQTARKVLKNQRPEGAFGEWEETPEEEWTTVQRAAAATKGVIAPSNLLITGPGHLLLTSGARDCWRGNYVSAFYKIFAARSGDVFDGTLARKTRTRSAFGAAFDSGGDALGGAMLAGVLAAKGLLPIDEAGLYVLQRSQTVYENARIRAMGQKPNPSETGKRAMAYLSFRLGSVVMGKALHESGHPMSARLARGASRLIGEVALQTGRTSVAEYHAVRKQLEATQLSQVTR